MRQHGAAPPNAGQIPVVTSILKDFSAEALGELRTWLEQNPPAVTIQSIIGFSQFTAQVAPVITTQESRTTNSFSDLATVGPTLSGLSNGNYLVLFGALVNNNAGGGGAMSVSVNGGAPSFSDRAFSDLAGANISVMRAVTVSLSAGNNTLTAQYEGNGAATSFWQLRWLIALRYSNA